MLTNLSGPERAKEQANCFCYNTESSVAVTVQNFRKGTASRKIYCLHYGPIPNRGRLYQAFYETFNFVSSVAGDEFPQKLNPTNLVKSRYFVKDRIIKSGSSVW